MEEIFVFLTEYTEFLEKMEVTQQEKLDLLLSGDLKKRGMKFVGTTIIYAYLQAVGVIYSHEAGCYLEYKKQG